MLTTGGGGKGTIRLKCSVHVTSPAAEQGIDSLDDGHKNPESDQGAPNNPHYCIR